VGENGDFQPLHRKSFRKRRAGLSAAAGLLVFLIAAIQYCTRRYRKLYCNYLREVNEVNGGDNVRCASVCVCVCARARIGPVGVLNANKPNSSKTVKATDFKFVNVFAGTVRT